jgi:hypothetical protein
MKTNLIRDPAFQNGFLLGVEKTLSVPDEDIESSRWKETPEASLNRWYSLYQTKLPFQNKEPDWILEQCSSHYQLSLDRTVKIKQSGYMFYNEAKKIERRQGGVLSLSIKGHKEYKEARKLNESWPYLVITQKFAGEYLRDYRSLTLSMDVDFDSFQNYMGDDFNPKLHTLQVIWYLLIGNLNPKSNGFGDFFFFGIPLIDCPRFPIPEEYEAEDYGKCNATHKFIHLIDSHTIMSKPFSVGTNLSFSHVCLSEIKTSFLNGQKRGYMKTSKFEDLELVSTSVGFEAEGTFDGGISLNSLAIEKEI